MRCLRNSTVRREIEVFHKMFVIVLIDFDTSGINNNMKIRFLFLLKITITIANYAIIFGLLV